MKFHNWIATILLRHLSCCIHFLIILNLILNMHKQFNVFEVSDLHTCQKKTDMKNTVICNSFILLQLLSSQMNEQCHFQGHSNSAHNCQWTLCLLLGLNLRPSDYAAASLTTRPPGWRIGVKGVLIVCLPLPV